MSNYREEDEFIVNLFYECYTSLLRYACSYLNNMHDAEEIVQETFLLAYLRIDEAMRHDNPEGWLMNTVKNKTMNAQSKRKRINERVVPLDENYQDHSQGVVASDSFGIMELMPLTKADSLTDDELKILDLRYEKRYQVNEIANELGINENAAYKRLERIKKKLKKFLS